jgi:hypothetical protein
MLHIVKLDRSYSPETIAVMTAAFDRVLERSLPALVSGMPQSVSTVRRVSTFAQTGGSLSHRLHS